MDRETLLAINKLMEVTKGMQNSIENLLNVGKLLKERVEKLEIEIDRMKES